MRFYWMSFFYIAIGVSLSLIGSVSAYAAESSALLSHSLQDDYQSSMAAQQQSVVNLSKIKNETQKKYTLNWDLIMDEKSFENPMNKENLFVLTTDLHLSYQMTSSLSANVTPSFSYFNGYTQTQNEVNGNNAVWTVKNATLDFKPWDSTLFSVGALNQKQTVTGQKIHSAVLMDSRSFPGAQALVSTGGNLDFGVMSEVAIPTSASMTTQTDDQESAPSFESAGAFMNYKNSRLKLEILADYFSYSHLPSSVAEQSGLLGNTVTLPNGQANSTDNEFAYDYHGIEADGKASVILANYWKANLESTYIQNSGAPSGSNQATRNKISVDWIAARGIQLSPTYVYYSVQSDAVVAAYNDSDYMPNMAGYSGQLGMTYRNNFKISVYGGERTPLVENPNQFHEHVYGLKLEMLNVAI